MSRSRCLLLVLWLSSCLGIVSSASAQGRFGPASDAVDEPGVRRAFVVGIDSYSDPAFPDLRFARRDAEELTRVLLQPELGGFGSVELLVDGDLSLQAIGERLERWASSLAPEDTALVYFSGHGTRWIDERGRSQVFLAFSDTRRNQPIGSGMPLPALQEFLASLPAGRRALVVDACFTGDGKVDSRDAEAAARSVVSTPAPFSDKVSDKEAQLFATTFGRPALESELLEHGVYTAHLIEALSEHFDAADLNGDLVVSVSEAHDFARDRTLETTGEVQIPMVFYKLIGREDFLLSGEPGSRRRAELAMVSAYEGPQQGLVLFVDGEEKGAFPRTVLVEPGFRRVEFRNLSGKTVDRGRFRFRAEGVYSARAIRDGLNGGRHRLALGYAHSWLPGEAHRSEQIPTAPGLRLGYSFRFPSRVPLLRRLGIAVDATFGWFGEQASEGGLLAPPTAFADLGIGPLLSLDLPYVVLSLQPRFAVAALFRSEVEDPFVNWVFGAVGMNFAVGVRPINRLSFQAQYSPMVFDVDLQGAGEPTPALMHRLVGTLELGF